MKKEQFNEIKARCEAAQKRWKHVWIADLRDCIAEIEWLLTVVEASKQCCAFAPDDCDMGNEHCKECSSWDYPDAVKKALET